MEKGEFIGRASNGYFRFFDTVSLFDGTVVALGGALPGDVGNIVIDSRVVEKGDLFVALCGSREDGEKYIGDAFMHGATAALCRRGCAERVGAKGIYIEVDDPFSALISAAKRLRAFGDYCVVGVTGSVGKTTVKELCINVLSARYPTDGTRGNFNNLLGLSLSILNAFGVSKKGELHGGSDEDRKKYLVLEMGISHKGEMDELADIARPDIAIITNVGSMHAEYLGGREGIASEKARMAAHGASSVICPYDSVILTEALKYVTSENITSVFWENGGTVDTDDCGTSSANIFSDDGEKFVVKITESCGIKKKYGEFTAPIVGKHGVFDTAIAVILGLKCGVSSDDIVSGINRFSPPSMRQEVRSDGGKIRIVDCYNSGPEAVRAALSSMVIYSERYGSLRRVAVLGDMLELGDISEREHFLLGRLLPCFKVELLFAVGEFSKMIARGAAESGLDPNMIFSFGSETDKTFIKNEIDLRLKSGDIILYKASRGIELEKLL